MACPKVVIDTNVILAAVYSSTGASHQILVALAEKVSALTTEEYLEDRAKRGSRKKFLRALARTPARPPLAGDEL